MSSLGGIYILAVIDMSQLRLLVCLLVRRRSHAACVVRALVSGAAMFPSHMLRTWVTRV